MGVHSKVFSICQKLTESETQTGISNIMRADTPAEIDRQEQRITGIIYGISQAAVRLCNGEREKEVIKMTRYTATGIITVTAAERRRKCGSAPTGQEGATKPVEEEVAP